MIFTSPSRQRAVATARGLTALGVGCAIGFVARGASASTGASLPAHADVEGAPAPVAEIRSPGGARRTAPWTDLSRTPLEPGRYELRVKLVTPAPGGAIVVPPCAGRGSVRVDGKEVEALAGPLVVGVTSGPHSVDVVLEVSDYERRIACGEPVRTGAIRRTIEGLGVLTFDSPRGARGSGKAVVYLPPGSDATRPRPLPWVCIRGTAPRGRTPRTPSSWRRRG